MTSARVTSPATIETGGPLPSVAEADAPRTRRWPLAPIAVIYVLLACLADLGAWLHGVGHTVQSVGGADLPEELWFLAQTPWAIVHGVNPLHNAYLNYPAGINLMDNTSMPLMGLLAFPVTALANPAASYTVLTVVSIAISAFACCVMVHRFVHWWPAAFAGGLVYGFSPLAVGEGNGHLFLLMDPIPPIVVILLDRILRTKEGSPATNGAVLGLSLAAQLYISAEFLTSLCVMAVSAVLVAALLLARSGAFDTRAAVRAAGSAAAVFAAIGGIGVFYALAGPDHISGPAQPVDVIGPLSSDPVGLVVPTVNQKFSFGAASYGDSLVAERGADYRPTVIDAAENGTYVGVPLLLLLVGTVIVLRRRWYVVFAAGLAAWAMLLSMGPRLHIGGHLTPVRLPFDLLAHLPVLDSEVASRFVEFFWLFVAVVLAAGLHHVRSAVSHRWHGEARNFVADLGAVAVGAVALFPLVPAWPYATGPYRVPTWFTEQARALPVGTPVLVYPLSNSSDASSMQWQAAAEMRFKMVGGYAIFTGPARHATFASEYSRLQMTLSLCSLGETLPTDPNSVRGQLRSWRIQDIVVDQAATGSGCARRLFEAALGPPSGSGGMWVWTQLQR